MLKNTETGYGAIAKAFHWLLFLMIGFMIVGGNMIAAMPRGAEKFEAIGAHKSLGLLILALILFRLAWRLVNVRPKDPEGVSAIQNRIAHAAHWLLYGLMLAQPLTGILMSQAAGYPVSFFGLFQLPALLGKNPPLAEFFHGAHGVVWVLLALVVITHAGAALYHHFVLKDDVLRRMGWGWSA
uniref:Cytochrome b561 n=1 Tax=Candidatus Kentrum sp. DK TaxID=2126562 RepID=A0A450SKV1_9GAMM|nr:MAG: cytochrome b561 [Candidatus Kentron sp. DK]